MKTQSHDAAVSGMFGHIAQIYDFLNHFLSFGIDYYWRKELVETLAQKKHDVILDLAAGTLDVSLALKKHYPNSQIPALDFCLPMLFEGKKKCYKRDVTTIFPIAADAKKLPLKDESVDCITIAFGIRNILPREEAFKEMLRVLKPGGRACILEFGSGKERIFGGLYNFYLTRILPAIGKFFSKDSQAYSYLAKTIVEFPKADEFEQQMQKADFVNTWYRKMTAGIVCLHVGEKKQN